MTSQDETMKLNSIQHLVGSVNYWKMPKRCAVFGCGITNKDGVSLFSFSKDPVLDKKWTEQVKRSKDKWLGPTKYYSFCVVATSTNRHEYYKRRENLKVYI